MSEQTISVEIFRDADRRDLSTEAAEAGVEHVRRVATGLEIVRTTRLLRIVQPYTTSFRPAEIRWPALEADINIVVTNRTLLNSRGERRSGIAEYTDHLAKNKATIDVSGLDFPHLVTAHEIGHLFHLKIQGKTWDKQGGNGKTLGHCKLQDCLMYKQHGVTTEEVRMRQSGVKKYLERYGYRKAEYQTLAAPIASDFCEECAERLERNAVFFAQAKAGKTILPEWL